MPGQRVVAVSRMPIPLDFPPQPADLRAQRLLGGAIAIKILPNAEQALEEVGGLDEIAAVVLPAETHRRAGAAIQVMGIEAMIARRAAEPVHDEAKAFERRLPCDPTAIDRHDDRHDAEAGAADADAVGRGARGSHAIERKAADRMRAIPKEADRLPLHEIEQGLVGLPRDFVPPRLGLLRRTYAWSRHREASPMNSRIFRARRRRS